MSILSSLNADLLNAFFEACGMFMVGLSCHRLYHDKKVRGLHWAQIAFFASWGWWNLFFYPAVGAMYSFVAGVGVTAVNMTYLGMIFYYTWKETQPGPRGNTRGKTWCETRSGKQFWLLDPHGDAVDPFDVGHAIAYQCRYNGHTAKQDKSMPWTEWNDHMSVAEHSCHLADYCMAQGWGPDMAFQALIHDGGEAYSGDIPRPWKNAVPVLRDFEAALDLVVLPALGGSGEKPEWLDRIDTRILQDERAQGRNPTDNDWNLGDYEALGIKLQFWSPEEAWKQWMSRYFMLHPSNRTA